MKELTDIEIIEKLCVKYNMEIPNCSLQTFVNLLVSEHGPLHKLDTLYDMAISGCNDNTQMLIAMVVNGDFNEYLNK